MALYGPAGFLGLLLALVFLKTRLPLTMAAPDCPLDLSRSNFTLAATLCSNHEDRGKCCRYINALVAVSISVMQTHQGRTTVTQMLQSPKFSNVTKNCKASLSRDNTCRKCLNAGILYLRNLLGPVDNLTLSTCRDATFAAIASQVDYLSTIDIASCFFGVQGLLSPTGVPIRSRTIMVGKEQVTAAELSSACMRVNQNIIVPSFCNLPLCLNCLPPSLSPPPTSATPPIAASPSQLSLNTPLKKNRHPYHLTIVPGIGIAVTALAITMVAVLVILIRRKNRELDDTDINDETSPKAVALPARKFQDGPSCMFRKFSYKETKKATNNFNTVIGQGGFGIVYKAEFRDGLVAAVKRMSKVSEQADDDFCREIELLARLHHRHLVALRGFSQGRTPLSWRTRIQIAIDVANALEYLHFYCDPPLCHRDIKSSNILLDENFVAKVADFGLSMLQKMAPFALNLLYGPEYVITQELTEKSDVYSYGVVLLELVTGRRAIQDNKNLIEWSQVFLTSESRTTELVDPYLGDTFDFDQLQTVLAIVRWCTEREGRARPSIKQVLRLLYESSDPLHNGFVEAVEDEECEDNESKGRKSRGKNVFSVGMGDV
ncbi:hypothetical protein DH2020_029358 [Rehmannia glutinosa]|uniref:Protein kinase domain-containing protein n=1 Tax=Rehmannia glutinosa TaxID=99300 RepID=A0ABR0VNU1_REHGL